MNPAPLHAQHRALSDMLRANAGCRCDRITRLVLDGLDEQARIYLRRLEKHLRNPIPGPFGSLGTFGENGAAPAIRDIIGLSKLHREKAQPVKTARRAA